MRWFPRAIRNALCGDFRDSTYLAPMVVPLLSSRTPPGPPSELLHEQSGRTVANEAKPAGEVGADKQGHAIQIDPRLFYGLVLPPGAGSRISIFQRFSEALIQHRWFFEAIVRLPATLVEPLVPFAEFLATRAIGLSGWRIRPLASELLDHIQIPATMPIWTLFSATKDAAEAASRFQACQEFRPLHVSLLPTDGAIGLPDLTVTRLRDHIIELAERHQQLADLKPLVERWSERVSGTSASEHRGHFSLLPNQMTLQSTGLELGAKVPDWTSEEPAAFEAAILEGIAEIDGLRAKAEIGPVIRFLPPRPDLWLIAPAVTPDFKAQVPFETVSPEDRRAGQEFLRRLERQRDYYSPPPAAEIERFENSDFAQSLRATRNGETAVFAAAIGARTAGSLASTIRLPPAVNLVGGRVSAFAENVRSGARTRPDKVARMFREIQQLLANAVGEPFRARIADAAHGVKLVTDAPLEWLEIDGLPLCLESDVSRIVATPGDAALLQLFDHEPLRLRIEDFAQVLLVSAFEPKDPLAPLMRTAVEITAPQFGDTLSVRHEDVTDRAQFLRALHAYDGPLMIFDGHGVHPRSGDGMLRIGDENVDVRQLRGRVRVPPIVVLSACDTHAAGRSAQTTANAFLALGARTVLATTLPIGGRDGAIFIARLLLRIAQFVPIAARNFGRVVRWSEVAGGMLRMQFVTDALRPRGKTSDLMTDKLWEELAPKAMYLAGRAGTGWIRWFGEELEKRGVSDPAAVTNRVRDAVPFSDTIRYTQMGNPETILIGELKDLSDEARSEFKGLDSELRPQWKAPPSPEPLEPPRLSAALKSPEAPSPLHWR